MDGWKMKCPFGMAYFQGLYLVSGRVSCFPFPQQSCKWKMTIFCFRCWRCCWMMAAIQSNISWCNNSLGLKQYNLHKSAILIETNIVPPNVISMKFDAWKDTDVALVKTYSWCFRNPSVDVLFSFELCIYMYLLYIWNMYIYVYIPAPSTLGAN